MLRSKQRRTNLFLTSLAILLVLVLVTACGNKNDAGGQGAADELATYKGGSVTKGEFDKFVDTVSFFNAQFASVKDLPEFQEYMLKQMVALDILLEEASEESKQGADEQVQQQMEEIRTYFNSQGENALADQLKELGIAEEDLESYIKKSLIVMNDLESKVTDEDIQQYYDELVAQNVLDVVTVSHVLVALKDQEGADIRTKEEALDRANEVKSKLDGGADFAEIAKQYSDDPGSKETGGTYENEVLGQSMWVPEFKQAAQELPLDTVSDPVETQHGYHVMRVDARNQQPLEEIREPIRDAITSERIGQFIEEELPDYDFKANLPEPSAPPEEEGQAPEGTEQPEQSPGTEEPEGSETEAPADSPAP